MAIAAGVYALTLEKMFIDTAAQSMEAETHKGLLTTDTYTPNFSTHDFRADVTNEVTGSGYTTGGATMTGTEWAIDQPAAGQMRYDIADPSWASSTISSAMSHIGYFNVGAATTDQLLFCQDFVTAVSTTNGTLTVQIHATDGVAYLDFTP
jgi:hypothetical protein